MYIRRVTPLSLLVLLTTLLSGLSNVPTEGLRTTVIPGDPPTWELLPNSPEVLRARHDDIFFVDESIGFVVSTRGFIWKTSDSGDTWVEKVDDSSGGVFRSVGFADPLHGWVGTVYTPEDVLMETTDGGETWNNISDRISGPAPSGICGLSVVNRETVFGVGAYYGDPVLIRTANGGASWTSKDLSSVAATLIDVHFFDELNGIAVGGTGLDFDGEAVVIRTADGGESWTRVHVTAPQPEVGGEWGWKITFPSRLVGFVSVEYRNNRQNRPARILKTIDGGTTWKTVEIPVSTDVAGLQGIGFVTPAIGWAGGRGTTSMTIDGGESWTQVLHVNEGPSGQLDGRINRIRLVNDSLAFAIGARVYRLRGTFNAPSSSVAPQRRRSFELDQSYPNPFSDRTTIVYRLFGNHGVRIEVHDARGRLVRILLDELQTPGRYSIDWDGTSENGSSVAAGVYFYLVDIGDSHEMKQLVRIK